MIDKTPRRARDQGGVVHEARISVRNNIPYLHPICDPKVRWDPKWETTCKVVCCFGCINDMRWIEEFMPGMQLDEYVAAHLPKHEIITHRTLGPWGKEPGG